jgi:AcrR family transcriptional regulator
MGATVRAEARPLPRGRHEFTREAVSASQRARLLDAVAEAVAAKGHAATTVADVVAAAAVSRRTFYEQFPDLEACFLAAYQSGMELLLEEIRDAVRAAPDSGWRGRVATSVDAYLAALAARPAAAWSFSIEAMGAGPRVLEHRALVMERWVRQWRELAAIARREERGTPRTRDDHLLLLVGGIEELVRERLREQGAEALPDLAARMTEIAVETLGGRR